MIDVKELQQLREDYHLTYERIAQSSGIPLPTVQKVLSEKTKNPRFSTLSAMAKGMGDLILSETDEKPALAKEDAAPMSLPVRGNLAEKKILPEFREDWDPSYAPARRYTVDDYKALPDDIRVELIDGVFYLMTAPLTIHQRLLANISYQLQSFVYANDGLCEVLFAPYDVNLDQDDKTMVQPDVMVICDAEKIGEKHLMGAPDLVIEVLSPSSRKKDMLLKLSKYMKAGVREYWIVDPECQRILVYQQGDGFFGAIYSFSENVPVGIWNGKCHINLSKIKTI